MLGAVKVKQDKVKITKLYKGFFHEFVIFNTLHAVLFDCDCNFLASANCDSVPVQLTAIYDFEI